MRKAEDKTTVPKALVIHHFMTFPALSAKADEICIRSGNLSRLTCFFKLIYFHWQVLSRPTDWSFWTCQLTVPCLAGPMYINGVKERERKQNKNHVYINYVVECNNRSSSACLRITS